MGCAVALKVLEVIRSEGLERNTREMGAYILGGLKRLGAKHPHLVVESRGLGLMIGLELAPRIPKLGPPDKPVSLQFVNMLHAAGVLTIPSGQQVIRLLPALNLTKSEAAQGVAVDRGGAGRAGLRGAL